MTTTQPSSPPPDLLVQSLKVAASEYRLYAEVHPNSPVANDLLKRADAMDILRLDLESSRVKLVKTKEKSRGPAKKKP